MKIKEPISKSEEIKQGDIFIRKNTLYILGFMGDGKYILIDLEDGNRWTYPTEECVIKKIICEKNFKKVEADEMEITFRKLTK
ncbi:MAG: hypothetical protein KJP21_05575 [Bacteroidia bacterium]|nr:hypothetical protein [Bacteroidia bacterium]